MTKPKTQKKTTARSRAGAREASEAKREKAKATFLDEYAERLSVTQSCKAVGMSRSTYYTWRRADPVFAGRVDEYRVDAVGALEESLYERAVGVKVETTDKYGNVTTRLEYSDKAAEMWLRANDPVRYGNKVAVSDDRPKTETTKLLDAILEDPVRRDWLYEALDVDDESAI